MRQDDLWMLDGDDPQEALPRAQRPDHLDFLRITPPDDDIMGDTPYCPKLERTVRVCIRIPHKHRRISPHSSIHAPTGRFSPFSFPFVGLAGIFAPLGHLIT